MNSMQSRCGGTIRIGRWRLARAPTVVAVAALFVLGGCGAGSSSPSPETTRIGDAGSASHAGAQLSESTADGVASPGDGTAAPAAGPTAANPAIAASSDGKLPHFAHIVIVVEENRAATSILRNRSAPYINTLAQNGALFTRSDAITHPSEPNYLALFSGSTQGLTNDSCPHSYSGINLAAQLQAAGKTFRGYSEGLPHAGYTGCESGPYVRKHAPWVNFASLPSAVNQPFSAFPNDYAQLPAVAFVVPNLNNDMHDGTIAQGDDWLRTNLGPYENWARTHDGLLVLTWDEDDGGGGNRIVTIAVGAHVKPGSYSEPVTHYRVLRTLDALEGLAPTGQAASTTPIVDIWAH